MFLMNASSKSGGGEIISSNPFSNINTGVVIIAALVAFVVAIVIFATIVERKKAPRGRFMKWLREYLNFRSILISGILRFLYLFLATLLTIMSIVVMCQGRGEMTLPMIGIGLAMLVFGNLFLRILLELIMAIIVMWENTSDIRSVLVKEEEEPEEKPKQQPATEEVVVEQQEVVAQQQPEVQQPVVQQLEAQQPEMQQPEVQ